MAYYLIGFIQAAYDSHVPFWLALHGVLAMQTRYRHLRGHLRDVWDSLLSWRMVRPVSSRTPARLEVVQGLSYLSVATAFISSPTPSYLCYAFALAVRLAFFGLLRPKELFALKVGDLVLPSIGTFRSLNVAIVRVLDPKNKFHMGRVQVRIIRDHPTIAWACWLVSSLPRLVNLARVGPIVQKTLEETSG